MFCFSEFGPGFGPFLAKQVRIRAFWKGSNRFDIQFWWTTVGSNEFEVRPSKYEAILKSIIFGLDPIPFMFNFSKVRQSSMFGIFGFNPTLRLTTTITI